MNNSTKAKFKKLNGKARSLQVANSNPRNKWNKAGKVARGKPAQSEEQSGQSE